MLLCTLTTTLSQLSHHTHSFTSVFSFYPTHIYLTSLSYQLTSISSPHLPCLYVTLTLTLTPSVTLPTPTDERERNVADQQDNLHHPHNRRSQKNDGSLRKSTKGVHPDGLGVGVGVGVGKNTTTSQKHGGDQSSSSSAGVAVVGVVTTGGTTPRAATGVQAMMDRYGHTLHDNQGE